MIEPEEPLSYAWRMYLSSESRRNSSKRRRTDLRMRGTVALNAIDNEAYQGDVYAARVNTGMLPTATWRCWTC